MSITTELQRISQAKADLKTSIEKRGVTVPTVNKIDTFAELFDSAPFAVKGTVTPEEDTLTVEINGLNFVPECIVFHNCELATTSVPSALRNIWFRKNHSGVLTYYKSTGVSTTAQLSLESDIVFWNDTGITLMLPDNGSAYFKKGYTYEFIISGGFTE